MTLQKYDISGRKFGKLTVISYAGRDKVRDFLWKCLCDCGHEKIVPKRSLIHGATSTCGKEGCRPRKIIPAIDRLMSKVDKTDFCWVWKGCHAGNSGYGYMTYKDKNTLVHRASWILNFGDIPEDLCVCHRCDNKLCVNPEHLFLGSDFDNAQDKMLKGRGNIGEKNALAKLTSEEVSAIRDLYQIDKIKQALLAKIFDVDNTNISSIIRRKTWAHIA